MKNGIFTLTGVLLLPLWVAAQNPISPMGVYIADPTTRVWQDGQLYIYGSTDTVPGTYCQNTYHVLSTDDLHDWTLHRKSFQWKETLYAPDASRAMRKACIEPIRFNEDGTIDDVEMIHNS